MYNFHSGIRELEKREREDFRKFWTAIIIGFLFGTLFWICFVVFIAIIL